jgi:hypothetical protein
MTETTAVLGMRSGIVRWTFGKQRTRDIYIVCNYADTRIKLTHKAPAEVTSCALNARGGTGVVCKQ